MSSKKVDTHLTHSAYNANRTLLRTWNDVRDCEDLSRTYINSLGYYSYYPVVMSNFGGIPKVCESCARGSIYNGPKLKSDHEVIEHVD